MDIIIIIAGIVFLIGIALYLYLRNVKKKIVKSRKMMSKKFKEAIKNGNIDEKNEKEQTNLMVAILGKFEKSAKNMIEAGADLSLEGSAGERAIHLAAHNSSDKLVNVLINHGADINVEDEHGCSPIWYAAQNGKLEVCKILIDNGAEINIQDKEYTFTPLMIAAQNGNYKVVDLLLNNGADKDIKTDDGKRAYDIAENMLLHNIKRMKDKKPLLEEMIEKLK
ncbi:MAG: ankyrin repeat domain-containing protein [Bacillota bacterium]